MPTNRRLSGFAWLATAIAVAMLLLVALGGAVRATDSGLACPTWPGCFSGGDFLPAWQWNVWLEHTHRLVAGAIAVLLTVQVGWAALKMRRRPSIVWASVVALVAVLVQAGLGALVVLQLLRAELVTAHLGMAMLVVACQLFIATTSADPVVAPPRDAKRLLRLSVIAAAVTLLQILVGGHVTGIGAGLVFADAPLHGLVAVAPAASQAAWFNIAHRVLAVAVLGMVHAVNTRARRSGAIGWLRTLPRVAAWLVVVQILLGVANLAMDLSAVTVIPHLAVASWIWAVLVWQGLLAWRAVPVSAATTNVADARVTEPA